MGDAPELREAIDEACGEAFGKGASGEDILDALNSVAQKWATVAEVEE